MPRTCTPLRRRYNEGAPPCKAAARTRTCSASASGRNSRMLCSTAPERTTPLSTRRIGECSQRANPGVRSPATRICPRPGATAAAGPIAPRRHPRPGAHGPVTSQVANNVAMNPPTTRWVLHHAIRTPRRAPVEPDACDLEQSRPTACLRQAVHQLESGEEPERIRAGHCESAKSRHNHASGYHRLRANPVSQRTHKELPARICQAVHKDQFRELVFGERKQRHQNTEVLAAEIEAGIRQPCAGEYAPQRTRIVGQTLHTTRPIFQTDYKSS